ncbi:Hypothetical protein, putative [Bodo saltans]|uniref:Uncharacterized protein n=1 Tax=Bodo saltans TaxID=75058 RepID=A0A0S4IU38_BODSA|nr:Hypothetical protein, putative [Bodo saltans]|eukprot:CUF94781.1 Hypothetical protein, putative [Bodo saltans]
MLQTLQKLLVVPPTTVKQMWLAALQYPQLFLRMFMHARAKQIVDEDDALYATFVLVCVADVDRVRSTDLVLVDATLPEKRLRNQTDPNLRKRASASSTDLSWLTPEDRQQWFIEEAEPILVLRACPRTVVPTTTIPMLRSENIVSRRGDDQNDAIDVDSPLLALTRRAEGFAHSDLGQSTKTIVVEAEPVEAAGKDQFDAHDFLDDDLVGGRDFTVFLSRVDVPLRCHSVIPQANSRVWKTLIALPLIIERKTSMITRMETRRQSAMLTHASSIRRPLSGRSATSAMLLPTAPSMSRTPSANGSRMGRWRRTDAASNNGSMRDEPLRKTPSVTPQPESLKPKASVVFRDSPVNQSVEEPNIVLPKLARFYWLPVSLQYTVSAQ